MNPLSCLGRALNEPATLTTLSLADWDILIAYARSAALLARLDALLEAEGLISKIPIQVLPHLEAAGIVADQERRVLNWEVNRIQRALRALKEPLILLKGAAYASLNLDISRGRISSDVDVLVSKSLLNAVEKALCDNGWKPIKLDDYDQYFYRHWSHELPPLQHQDRRTVVDVHHTLLPPTGRLHPDPIKLIKAAVVVPGTSLKVLAPADMLLHSAAHAFQDGDLTSGLRDLLDLDGLFRHFGTDAGFWDQLLPRARELQLSRPLYYALRYTSRILNTPIPGEILDSSQTSRPPQPVLLLMDKLVVDTLRPRPHRDEGFALRLSAGLLYVRSHWLRMPPRLLVRHLVRKWLTRKSHA